MAVNAIEVDEFAVKQHLTALDDDRAKANLLLRDFNDSATRAD